MFWWLYWANVIEQYSQALGQRKRGQIVHAAVRPLRQPASHLRLVAVNGVAIGKVATSGN